MEDKFEKLVKQIMAEAEEDDEPVTREEAEEMARMELGANEIKNYTQATVKKERKLRERKVDETKKEILQAIYDTLIDFRVDNGEEDYDVSMENETDIHFTYKGDKYSLKLTKHRPPKK